MSRDPRLTIITETLRKPVPDVAPADLISGSNVSRFDPAVNVGEAPAPWAIQVDVLARRIYTALYGRPDIGEQASPLARAEDAKRRRDLVGEVGALMSGHAQLTSADWYPARTGDLIHVHYEAGGISDAFGETYLITAGAHGFLSMQLLAHTLPETEDTAGLVGCFAVEDGPDPLSELWMEAGPHRLTIVRDGQVVHDGPRSRHQERPQQQNKLMLAFALTCADAQRYLERGDTAAALARLRKGVPLPRCGTPGPMPGHQPCARWKGHHGACSPDADYTEPAHECPALPEQLHAVVTVGAKVTGVHFAGLYTDIDAAIDHASGFTGYRDSLDERFVEDAPGAPGEKVLKLPQENQLAAYGVQLAVTVPLTVLPDPRAAEEWAAEGIATTLTADDYADDFRNVDE